MNQPVNNKKNKTQPDKNHFNKKLPCKACIKRNIHCCRRVPVFSNEEAANLIDSRIFEKINRKKQLIVVRYTSNSDLWVFIPKKFKGKEYKTLKKLEKTKKDCFFFDKEKGCLIGDLKPAVCKEIRNPDSLIYCPLSGLSNEEISKKDLQELADMQNNIPFLNYEKVFLKCYGNEINKPFLKKLKFEFDNPKHLKYSADELFFVFIDYVFRMNADINNTLFKIKEKKRLVVDKKGEVVIYTDYFYLPLEDSFYIKLFAKKMNNIIAVIFGTYTPMKIDIMSRRIDSLLKGLHKQITYDDLQNNFGGFLLTALLLRVWQDERKNKDPKFKGIFTREEINKIGNIIISYIDNSGIGDDEFKNITDDTAELAKALYNKFFNQKGV